MGLNFIDFELNKQKLFIELISELSTSSYRFRINYQIPNVYKTIQ